jgi:hypothetical protein
MASLHLDDDTQLDAWLDAPRRDPVVLEHVRGCSACLARIRDARRERLLLRAALATPRTTDDHPSADALAAFCDEQLDDDATRAVATQLAECPACLAQYVDLVELLAPDAMDAPDAGSATEARRGFVPAEVAAGRASSKGIPTASPTPSTPTPMAPTPGTFGTVFITRFADALELTFIATPAGAFFSGFGSARSGSHRGDFDTFDAYSPPPSVPPAAGTRRAELRSRSFSTVVRALVASRRENRDPPRPSVRLEMPGVVATLELVDLADAEVEFTLRVLPSRTRRSPTTRVLLTAPGRKPHALTLDTRTPVPFGPIPTPATITFEGADDELLRIEIRNLVHRPPPT